MSQFERKLVAVMNKSIESGVIMNSLAHMSIAFGAKIGPEALQLVDYIDKDNHCYPDISKMPFIILQANSNKIRALYQQAIDHNIQYSVFTNTMTEGGWEDQVARTASTYQDDLIFYGIVLFGDYAKVSEITRKFSLWR
jgi:hypothetical protein